MNKIIVSGGLGRDAELKSLPSGKNVLEFSIAVNSGFGDNKKTYWWKAKLFGDRAAKLAEYFVKGTRLMIEGVPELREYEAKDGSGKRISPEIFVTDFEFMGGKKEQTSDNAFATTGFAPANDSAFDVPFLNMTERNRRGRPKKGSKRRRIYVCGTALIDRSIMPDEALALVQGLPCSYWTYKTLAAHTKKPLKEAMQIMNDLLHYGLVRYHGKDGKESVFERYITYCE